MDPVSVIIPNWNGAALLRRHLPAVLYELEQWHPESECIVVDDGSIDGSVSLLRESFPTIRLIRQHLNRGFSSAVNAGIAAARNEQLLLLNNDVEVTRGFLGPLQSAFAGGLDTFASAALQRYPQPNGETVLDGFNTMCWRNGHIEFLNRTDAVVRGESSSLAYCTAGCSLFSKEKLLALGGFCELFDPFYYEDAEVNLQAARQGWRLAFAPDSVVEHHHGSSSRWKPWKLRLIPVRNHFLLHWLLLDTPALWWRHITGVGFRLVGWTLQGRIRYAIGLCMALAKLPAVARERLRRARGVVRSTADLLRDCDYGARR